MATTKLSRRLTIRIEPFGEGKYAVAVVDATTRPKGQKRHNESETGADTWSEDAVVQSFELLFREFARSLEQEDQELLFAETPKTGKPRRDPK